MARGEIDLDGISIRHTRDPRFEHGRGLWRIGCARRAADQRHESRGQAAEPHDGLTAHRAAPRYLMIDAGLLLGSAAAAAAASVAAACSFFWVSCARCITYARTFSASSDETSVANDTIPRSFRSPPRTMCSQADASFVMADRRRSGISPPLTAESP